MIPLAREAAAAVEGLAPVEVTGTGPLASLVRELVGTPAGEGAPAAIVETTGDPETIRDALRRLADRGTLVLAGDAAGRRLDLDLYPDVHVRGLRLVGLSLPPPVARPGPAA